MEVSELQKEVRRLRRSAAQTIIAHRALAELQWQQQLETGKALHDDMTNTLYQDGGRTIKHNYKWNQYYTPDGYPYVYCEETRETRWGHAPSVHIL